MKADAKNMLSAVESFIVMLTLKRKKDQLELIQQRTTDGHSLDFNKLVEREILNDYPPSIWRLIYSSVLGVLGLKTTHRNVVKAVVASS